MRVACNLHWPNCSCPNKWRGLHYRACEVFRKFHKTLKTGEVHEKDEDLLEPTFGLGGKILDPGFEERRLCCCQDKAPHDETQKFMIIRHQPEKVSEDLIKSKKLTSE